MNDDVVLQRFVEYHDHICPPPTLIIEDLRRGRRRVRRNRGVVTGAVALGLLSVVAAATLLTGKQTESRLQPADPPALSTPLVAPQSPLEIRNFGFRIEPGPGLYVTDDWGVGKDLQRTGVVLDGGLELGVDVYYQGRSPQLPSTGTRERVVVHGAAGTYVEDVRPDYWGAHLVWEYAPDSWAAVSGRGLTAPPSDLRGKLLTVAEAVRAGGDPVRVPVRVGTVPTSLPPMTEAHGLDVSYDGGEWTWWLSVGDISIWATSRVGGACMGSGGEPQTAEFTYRGHPGCDVAGERLGLHLDGADVFFDYGTSPDLPREEMKALLADLTVASGDRATWFDLETALGG